MTTSQGAAAPASPLHAALSACIAAHNVTGLAHSCIHDLAAVFAAIHKLTDEHSLPHELAGVGHYLAEDWANLYDIEKEEAEQHVVHLRSMLGQPEPTP